MRAALLIGAVLAALVGGPGGAQPAQLDGGRRNQDAGAGAFLTNVPATAGSVIAARPTDRAVTLSVMLRETATVRVSYGPAGSSATVTTGPVAMKPGEPAPVLLEGLEPDTAYAYRVLDAATGKPILPEAGPGGFHTCRRPGSAFTFTVQADSHLDGTCLPALYTACLQNALADRPDFLIDLGDTFMTGKHASREEALGQYTAQRHYLGMIGASAAVFLTVGNHDGEESRRRGYADAESLAVWSCLQRKRMFPNPAPNAFYSGNAEPNPYAGLLEDYYAWTWGDALFVVLDPYWTSRNTRGGTEPWNMTIGKAQYDWLARTLRASRARHRFVFIHQLTGGLDPSGRGGSEAARLYEWGGREKDGSDTFGANRPGWDRPIHRLLAENGVEAVFHGHDHFYARQVLDGVVYQLVPQPSQRNVRSDHAEEYGYVEGDFLPGSGHLRVRVTPETATVEYVRAAVGPDMARLGLTNGQVARSYVLRSPAAAGSAAR